MDIPKLLRDVDADFRNIKTGLTPLNSCSSGGFFSDLSTPTLFMTPTTNQDGQFFSNLDSLTISKGNAVNNSHNGSNNVSQPNAPKLEVSPSGNLYSKRQSGASLDEGQIAQFMSTTTAMNNGGGGTITYDHTPASSSISDTSGPNHPTQSTMPMAVSVGSSHKVKSKKQRTSAGSQLSSSTNGHSQQCASEKKFQCSHVECSKTFARSDELKRHQRTHNNMRPYVCSYCDKCFTRSDHLRTHVRTHTGEKPFPCDKCGRRFARSDERSRHQKTHERSSGHSRVSAEGGKKKSSTAGKQQRVDTFASPAAVSGMVQKMDSENAPALMTTTHTMQQQQHHPPHSTLPLSLPLHPHHNHHHHAPHHSVLHPHRLSSIVHTNTPSHDCAHVT